MLYLFAVYYVYETCIIVNVKYFLSTSNAYTYMLSLSYISYVCIIV